MNEHELQIPAPYNQYYEFSPNEINFDELPDAFDHYKDLKVVAELYAKEQYEDALANNALDFCWLVSDNGRLMLVTTAGLRVYPITLEEIQDCVGESSYDDDYDDYDDLEEGALASAALALGTAAATGFGQSLGNKIGSKLLGEDSDEISRLFQPGDHVYVSVSNRSGRVIKMITPDLVEVELDGNGIYPARIDRFYTDSVELIGSDSELDDDF